ncbi:MAG: magnesium chelatase [Spirochaetes bacterium RBG_13_51_14]|nr:MAG: magnesium chelatase [Spirochaetes bacterium RBG_13_51_14]
MSGDVRFNERIKLTELNQTNAKITGELKKVIVGQDQMIELLLAAVLANGHVLLEGVPGIAKTLTAKLLSMTMSIDFSRIQFTPDLMPSDIIGTTVFNVKRGDFEFKKGPVFSNLVLIDEINRAPAKTQSALFEVMEERQVTVDGKTYFLEEPFLVFATQNPIEYEGTYRLPEAQLDRFLFKIKIGYPSLEEEFRILSEAHARRERDKLADVKRVVTGKQIIAGQKKVKNVHIDDNVMKYIAEIIHRTRNHAALYLGGSPRASLAVMDGAKALAVLRQRDFVKPEDIQTAAFPALRHRLLLTPEKEMEGRTPEDIIEEILQGIEVPR